MVHSFVILHDFNVAAEGRTPYGSLVESSNGKLYGMTSTGGSNGYNDKGVLFEYDTATSTYTKKVDFHDTTGYKPIYTTLIKIVAHADWTGAISTDWHNPGNWQQNAVPDPFTEVSIPDVSSASGRFPSISSNVKIRKLIIDDNATLDLGSGITLEVDYK